MEWSEFLNTDTVKLTVIPGILVFLVLIFWFKRSGKKRAKMRREFGRAPNSRHDNLDWATAVAEADQEVRLGQAYDLDVLDDEVIAVKSSKDSAKSSQRDDVDHLITDIDDDYDYPVTRRKSRQDVEDMDFLDEAESVYTRVDNAELAAKASYIAGAMKKTSDSIVYNYEDDVPATEPVFSEKPATLARNTKEQTKQETKFEVKSEVKPEVKSELKQDIQDDESAAQPESEGLILVLNVVSGVGRQFRGPAILKALTATGLTFGTMNIFHYLHPTRPGKPMFSVANMIEPGCFTLTTMDELTSPGLTLFANVARPEEGVNTFTVMLETAKKLAEILGGEVCDERRGTLSKQGVEHIHGQIREHQRRSRLVHAARA